jgi:hypothetical protein
VTPYTHRQDTPEADIFEEFLVLDFGAIKGVDVSFEEVVTGFL